MDMDDQDVPKTEQKRSNWWLYLSIGVLVLVCALVLYLVFSVSDPDDNPIVESYGPWQFTWSPPIWKTFYRSDDQLYEIQFRYLPQEVDNITVRGSDVRLAAPLYLSFDPDMSNASKSYVSVAFSDASTKLTRMYGISPIAACTSNLTDPACAGFPQITCSSNVSAIVFTEAVEPSLTIEGSCISIEGTGEDLYRAETLMWYRLLDIVR